VSRPAPDAPIVITGASGFLGRALLRNLERAGRPVIAISRMPRTDTALVTWRVADLTGDDLAPIVPTGATIVHLGATLSGPSHAVRDSIVDGTRRVLDTASARGAQVCHLSSLAVLDPAALAAGRTIDEDTARDPDPQARGSYTEAKIVAEAAVEAFLASGGRGAIVRPAQLVGNELASVPPSLGVQVGPLRVMLGPDTPGLAVVHVDDAAEGVLIALADQAPGLLHLVDRVVPRRRLLRRLHAAGVPGAGTPTIPASLLVGALGTFHAGWRRRARALGGAGEWEASRARQAGWRPHHLEEWLSGEVTPPAEADGAPAAITTR
jgi:nucleoside-diphosphate-sugar epimerase